LLSHTKGRTQIEGVFHQILLGWTSWAWDGQGM